MEYAEGIIINYFEVKMCSVYPHYDCILYPVKHLTAWIFGICFKFIRHFCVQRIELKNGSILGAYASKYSFN